jgi:hypothetical protein
VVVTSSTCERRKNGEFLLLHAELKNVPWEMLRVSPDAQEFSHKYFAVYTILHIKKLSDRPTNLKFGNNNTCTSRVLPYWLERKKKQLKFSSMRSTAGNLENGNC